jgi:FdhD protein
MRRGLQVVPAQRCTGAGAVVAEEVALPVEEPCAIAIVDGPSFALLCTPLELEALAVGFLLSEGVVTADDQIVDVDTCDTDPGVVRVRLAGAARCRLGSRNLMIASGCGACGQAGIDRLAADLPQVGDRLRLDPPRLAAMRRGLEAGQAIFAGTGGTHAAALFDPVGAVLAVAEDIGRHNALDKAAGRAWLRHQPIAGCGVSLSGRVSFDLVAKCARLGIELIAAVSAPTAMAVAAAKGCGITLCGFVRDERATVFSHPHRLGLGQPPS